jgi:dTDP-4-amino-4,6-dideoxygalactose transaminase
VICGEGGAIAINRSAERARRALVLWEKGTNRYDFMAGKLDKYEWVDLGSSYVPSEVSCAILYAQLEDCQRITSLRLENYHRYLQGLQPLMDKGIIRVPQVPEGCEHNAHIFYIIFKSLAVRQAAEEEFKRRGISAFSHYVPLHSAPAGVKYGRVGVDGQLTVTNAVYDGLLRLPIWIGLRLDELNYIVQAVEEICSSLALSRAIESSPSMMTNPLR